jgi:putative flippase GtrA
MHITSRFIRFSTIGILSFAIDISLLYILTDHAHIPYLGSAACAFAVATLFQYLFMRKHTFKESKRAHDQGYSSFMAVSLFNLLIMLVALSIAVEFFHFNYLIARIIIATLVGIWNFFATSKFVFNVELIKP